MKNIFKSLFASNIILDFKKLEPSFKQSNVFSAFLFSSAQDLHHLYYNVICEPSSGDWFSHNKY